MKLILVRHAEAVALGEAGAATDFDRPLTETGRHQAEALAKALAKLRIQPQAIFTSPAIRAIETATPIAAALTPDSLAQPCDFLRLEEMKPRKFSDWLNETGYASIVLVGHMPDMGKYAGWLLGCDSTTVAFDKSTAALIACGNTAEKGRGELRWLATPEWFVAPTSP